jgi:hypothetical protein
MSQNSNNSNKTATPIDNSVRLEALEKTIEQISKNKKKTAITGYAGIIVVIITLIVFVASMYSFFNEYNTLSLAKEMQKRLPALTDSKNANELYTTVEGTLLPKYTKALMVEFKEKAPIFAQDLLIEKEGICLYLQNNVKTKLANNLIDKLSNSEAQNLTIYFKHKLPAEKLAAVSKIVHDVLQEKLTTELNTLLAPAMDQINDINESFETLYVNMHAEDEFKGITPSTIGEIENRFIETLLESLIYEINPQKGSELSSVK